MAKYVYCVECYQAKGYKDMGNTGLPVELQDAGFNVMAGVMGYALNGDCLDEFLTADTVEQTADFLVQFVHDLCVYMAGCNMDPIEVLARGTSEFIQHVQVLMEFEQMANDFDIESENTVED